MIQSRKIFQVDNENQIFKIYKFVLPLVLLEVERVPSGLAGHVQNSALPHILRALFTKNVSSLDSLLIQPKIRMTRVRMTRKLVRCLTRFEV